MESDDVITILLLEDDELDYRLLTKSLNKQSREFEIVWVETLAEAVAELRVRAYDAVLTDLSVPDSCGIETVSVVKEHSGDAPVIVLTGSDDEEVENRILSAGAQEYLLKGEMSGRNVTRAIVHALQRQQSINEVRSLVTELERHQQLLKQQTKLLHTKNQRLRDLYKSTQEFVDNVSHDFRTPLTVIKDYASIIREGMVGEVNDEQRRLLERVGVRADDLNIMVDDLLDMSKSDSGLLRAWRRSLDPAEVFEGVISLLQQRAKVRGVELEVDVEPGLPSVYCDAEKAARVISNLAVNAIKFAGDPGQVRLWAEADPAARQVVVGVTDNGPGIDEESLNQVFQRFHQLNTEPKSAGKGFGLGLNIAQRLCLLNLGELSVRSRPGEGSTFSFTLPYAEPAEVLRRWLSQQSSMGGRLWAVEIWIDERSAADVVADFENFLHCLLRGNDLLLRTEHGRWRLLMIAPTAEADRWFDRAQKEFDKTNRNRPVGPLPMYETEISGEWDSWSNPNEVAEHFERTVRTGRSTGVAV